MGRGRVGRRVQVEQALGLPDPDAVARDQRPEAGRGGATVESPDQELEWQRVERYASYPVSEDEADTDAAEAEPELYAAAQEVGAE